MYSSPKRSDSLRGPDYYPKRVEVYIVEDKADGA